MTSNDWAQDPPTCEGDESKRTRMRTKRSTDLALESLALLTDGLHQIHDIHVYDADALQSFLAGEAAIACAVKKFHLLEYRALAGLASAQEQQLDLLLLHREL